MTRKTLVILVAAAVLLVLLAAWRFGGRPPADAGDPVTIRFEDGSEIATTMGEIYRLRDSRPSRAFMDEGGVWNVAYQGKVGLGRVKRRSAASQH